MYRERKEREQKIEEAIRQHDAQARLNLLAAGFLAAAVLLAVVVAVAYPVL